jgi:hypothetical protein
MVDGVWAKILVILSCTLAGGREPLSILSSLDEESTCLNETKPCSEISKKIEVWHVITPIYIAGAAWLVVAMPTIFLAGRHRARGVRELLCVLILLWIHLIILYCWYFVADDLALAYVWGVHSSAHVLATWRPRRFVLVCQDIQPWVKVLGVLCVALFAKELGVPVGLVPWQSGMQAQCGLRVHLFSIIGIDFVGWILGPARRMMVS